MSAEEIKLAVTGDEAWMLYDLVTARTELIEEAETATRSNCGGEPWRLLRRKLRAKLPTPMIP